MLNALETVLRRIPLSKDGDEAMGTRPVTTRLRWLPTLVVVFVVAAEPSYVRAQLDPVAELQGLLDFVCGVDPDRCLDREPPLSEEDIAVLGAELARLLALAEAEDSDPVDESIRFEAELLQRCDRDAAQCWVWIQKLARAGLFDADLDGVFDEVDLCPGSPTPSARARSILLAQQRALNELRDVLGAVRLALLHGANGTLGSAERHGLARTVESLFFELVSIANERVDARFLFGGERDDRVPFAVSGAFDTDGSPTVAYQGSPRPGSLPVGRSGEPRPITIPGSRLFLADRDGDGRFPDAPGADLFAVLVGAWEALRGEDVEGMLVGLQVVDEAISFQIADEVRSNGDTYAALRRSFARRELANVDATGCSQEQFCASVSSAKPFDGRLCEASDYLNDEPLANLPRDCRARRASRKGLRCEAWTAEPRR